MSDELLSFWYRALHADVGVRLSAVDPIAAKRKLYAARTRAEDPALKDIALVPSRTNPSHILLIRKDVIEESV